MSGVAFPSCVVDIYPYEGGRFTVTAQDGHLLNCQVRKSIREPQDSRFQLTMAPGGPFGAESSPQWLDLLRPMSLVVIAMQRMGRAHTVMIGLITGVQEPAVWETGRSVQRSLTVNGRDFSHIFLMPDFYGSLFMLAQAAVLGQPATVSAILQQGMTTATLKESADAWYNKIMVGTNQVPGTLSKLNFAYQGSRVTFGEVMSTFFDEYPGLEVILPTTVMWAVLTGTWMDTFSAIYPFPWFELFVATAEEGVYGQPAATKPIQSSQIGTALASPCLIARFNPIPILTNPAKPQVNMTRWLALPVVSLDTIQPLSRSLTFSDAEVMNFYVINPRYLGSVHGFQNGDLAPFLYRYGVWLDAASVARYGYRPFIANPSWFADPQGTAAKQNAAKGDTSKVAEQAVGTIALMAASYYEPTPLMASGTVITGLRPDINIGTKLRFPPAKNTDIWEFYIDAVAHEFSFGGRSLTTLSVCRGLPLVVYQDQDLMTALLQGNAMRQNGVYQKGLPEGTTVASLQSYNLQSGPNMFSSMTETYNVPGKK